MGKTQLTPYEVDYARWCAEQGALLRDGNLHALDRENLAEEIEGLGRGDKREIESRLNLLLVDLLLWNFLPGQRSGKRRTEITEQRWRIARVIKDSPSLGGHPARVLRAEYALARKSAFVETTAVEERFPEQCPFAIGQVLDQEFMPE